MPTILSITIGFCLFLFGYFLHIIGTPEELPDPGPVILPHEDDGYLTQQFINQRWRMQAVIRECNDLATLSDFWHDIDRLEWDYRDAIPDQVLITHVDELFAFHALRAGQLKDKLSNQDNVFDKPEISLL